MLQLQWAHNTVGGTSTNKVALNEPLKMIMITFSLLNYNDNVIACGLAQIPQFSFRLVV